MSEKTLNNVIRNLRMGNNYLQMAEDVAEQLLKNHTVANEIRLRRVVVKDYIYKLDTEYRVAHYARRTR